MNRKMLLLNAAFIIPCLLCSVYLPITPIMILAVIISGVNIGMSKSIKELIAYNAVLYVCAGIGCALYCTSCVRWEDAQIGITPEKIDEYQGLFAFYMKYILLVLSGEIVLKCFLMKKK